MTNPSSGSGWRRELGFGLLAIIAVAATSVLGQLATYPNLAPWYARLVKPSFSPPNWIFGPVWTTLYVLMAFAVWRILRLPEASAARRLALTLFFIQLALNAAWSWMFFGANNPAWSLPDAARPEWRKLTAKKQSQVQRSAHDLSSVISRRLTVTPSPSDDLVPPARILTRSCDTIASCNASIVSGCSVIRER